MKKFILLFTGLAFIVAFVASDAVPLMPNATIIKANFKPINNVINGIVINSGSYVLTPMYLFGEISDSTFPKTVAAKSSGEYILNIEPSEIWAWTTPIFYGDNKKSQSGSNGCYFQFQLSECGSFYVAYSAQGKANCSYSGQMLTVDFTNF